MFNLSWRREDPKHVPHFSALIAPRKSTGIVPGSGERTSYQEIPYRPGKGFRAGVMNEGTYWHSFFPLAKKSLRKSRVRVDGGREGRLGARAREIYTGAPGTGFDLRKKENFDPERDVCKSTSSAGDWRSAAQTRQKESLGVFFPRLEKSYSGTPPRISQVLGLKIRV